MIATSPFTLPFDPFDSGIVRDVLDQQSLTLGLELLIIAALVTRWSQRRFQGAHDRRSAAELSGWCSLPLLAWALTTSVELNRVWNQFHPNEVLIWLALYPAAIALGLVVLAQGLTTAILFPRAPSLGLGGSSKTTAMFALLFVLLDSFLLVYFLRWPTS